MPRLFISHSSHDNAAALAICKWLEASGWSEGDVFIDLHDLTAGARWRSELRRANTACEAVLLLASPEALDSPECQEELKLADILEKEIIPVIVRDLAIDDVRLKRWTSKEIQVVDLRNAPLERLPTVDYKNQRHDLSFSTAALSAIKARLDDLGISPGSFPWTPHTRADGTVEGPYPGLSAFGEDDAGIFFGREADIIAGLAKLKLMRKRRSPRLLVIQAASGAGKSSYLRAGLWPRLKRDPDFVPLAIVRPAQGIVSGPDGLGQRISPWFERQRKKKVPGDIEAALLNPDLTQATAALGDILSEATALATAVRRVGIVDARPPAPLIGVDQGEEMFASENTAESDRFLALLAGVFHDLPEDVDPYVLLTIRADSLEPLLQRWPSLGLAAPEMQALPPLSPTAYRDVIAKPAEVYSRRVRRLVVEPALADHLASDATGADALPLLAFTLEKLCEKFGADGNLTLARYEGLGGIGGSIDKALAEAQKQAGAAGSEANLKRLMVPGLATWDPAAGAAKRLVAAEADLVGGNRASLKPLADALVVNRLLTRGAGTLEVAHEALLRRPLISGWLEAQKDALKLRDDVLKEADDWAKGGKHAENLVRRGARLEAALALQVNPDFATALAPARDYLEASRKLETAGRRRSQRTQAFVTTLLLGIIAGLVAFINKKFLEEQYTWRVMMQSSVLTEAQEKEKAASPGPTTTFAECKNGCPTMVVVPAGQFMMGTADEDPGVDDESPQHEVKIAQPFAVSRTEITWEQWNACTKAGGCNPLGPRSAGGDEGWGEADRPLINISWEDAKYYTAWLSKLTGQDYRLLSEAEWEYAARGGNPGKWSFGDDEKLLGDYVWYTKNSDGKTQPVAKKKANAFGLYDMHGNVLEWVEDCYKENYEGAPPDGKAVRSGDCSRRVIRGGSCVSDEEFLVSARRFKNTAGYRA